MMFGFVLLDCFGILDLLVIEFGFNVLDTWILIVLLFKLWVLVVGWFCFFRLYLVN